LARPSQKENGVTQPSPQSSLNAVTVSEHGVVQPTLVHLFATEALTRPSSIALELSDRSFTYAFLDGQAERLAISLKAQGVTRGDVVALCLRRTENLVVALLGVLRAGAAYLPLSPKDPALRLGQVIAHAGAKCIVTDANSEAHLPQTALPILRLERQLEGQTVLTGPPAGEGSKFPPPAPADTAYVIYTSGTTGTPKGVVVTHQALANVTADVAHRVAFAPGASWLAVTTVAFDIAALELLLPLCYGGKVILATEDQARTGRVLAGILRNKCPAVMQATPITWRILIESGWKGSPGLTILCGGDRLDRTLANHLLERCAVLWNMYGPTETTIWSTADRLMPGSDPVTIGRPLLHTEVYILDTGAHPMPVGDIGEICIGGAGVARWYVNDPELTEQKFIYVQIEGAAPVRVYRTGDLGRWNATGKLEFHGRIDQQVKINGFRIEVAEVEHVIRCYPGLADVAVLGIGGATNQKRLYAFVVSEPGASITTTSLVAHLEHHLPRYMVPEKFCSLQSLPVTQNGKRDVAALEGLARVSAELLP
jgi:amino acid adenylation domain-containing protein